MENALEYSESAKQFRSLGVNSNDEQIRTVLLLNAGVSSFNLWGRAFSSQSTVTATGTHHAKRSLLYVPLNKLINDNGKQESDSFSEVQLADEISESD